jgi:hypothetical protein
MITWFCTRRFVKTLGVKPIDDPRPATTKLCDWHANVIPSAGGDLFIFSNNRTFVAIGIPISAAAQIEPMFFLRVGNLLKMLGVPEPAINLEVDGIVPIQYARARDKRQLGHLQSIAYQFQAIADHHDGGTPLSLSDAEVVLAGMPHLGSFNSIPVNEIHKLFDPSIN